MVIQYTLPSATMVPSKRTPSIDGKESSKSVRKKELVAGTEAYSADKILHRSGKTLNRWAGLKPDTYALPNAKKYSFAKLDEGLSGLQPLSCSDEEMPDFESDASDDTMQPNSQAANQRAKSPPKHGLNISVIDASCREEGEAKQSTVRYMTSKKLRRRDSNLSECSDEKEQEIAQKRRRRYRNKSSFHIGYDQLGWDMDALFQGDADDEGGNGNVLESIVSIHLLQPSQHMHNGALGERIDSVVKGKSSANFMKISRVHADMRNRIDAIARHIDEVQALEDNEFQMPGKTDYGAANQAVNNTKHADVALRMRQIRKVLQSLNWPALHVDLKRWVRRSGETEQTMRDFLEVSRANERDCSQLLQNTKHQADHSLATRELTMANVMGTFNTKLTALSDRIQEKQAEKRAAMAEVEEAKAQAQQEADAQKEAQNKAERSKVLKLLSKKVTDQERVIRQVERAGPAFDRPDQSGPTQNTKRASITGTQFSDEGAALRLGDNFVESDLDMIDDGRYGHLKGIFNRHAEKIRELTQTLERSEKELKKVQQKLVAKFEEEQTEVDRIPGGKADHGGKHKKNIKGSRFVALVPPDMQQRLALRRERDALCKFLNEVTCEDISHMPATESKNEDKSPEGKSEPNSPNSPAKVERFGSNTGGKAASANEEEDDDGTLLLQGKITDSMKRCDEIITEVNRKANEIGYEKMWEFDPKSFQLFFHVNPERPMLDVLLECARAALTRIGSHKGQTKANNDAEHNLQLCIKSAVAAIQADKDARVQWYEQKKEFRMKNSKATIDKVIESLQHNIAAAKVEGRRLSTEAEIVRRQRTREQMEISKAVENIDLVGTNEAESKGTSDNSANGDIVGRRQRRERTVDTAEVSSSEKVTLLAANNDDIDQLASKAEDDYKDTLLQADDDDKKIRNSLLALEKDKELWDARADQARQIVEKQEAINDLQKQIQELRVELGMDVSPEANARLRDPVKKGEEVVTTRGQQILPTDGTVIATSDAVTADSRDRFLSQSTRSSDKEDNSALEVPQPKLVVSSPGSRSSVLASSILGQSKELSSEPSGQSKVLLPIASGQSREVADDTREGTPNRRQADAEVLQSESRLSSRQRSRESRRQSKDSVPSAGNGAVVDSADENDADNQRKSMLQKTNHVMPSPLTSKESRRSERSSRSSRNVAFDGAGVAERNSVAREATSRNSKKSIRSSMESIPSESAVSSEAESESYSGSESYGSSEEEEPVSPLPQPNPGRRDSKLKKMSTVSQPDLESVVKQCEKSNAVLRKRREAKYSAFKRTLVKLGLSKEAEAVGAPESINEKQARIQKEMLAQKAALANLNRMVNFWEARILQRSEALGDHAGGLPQSFVKYKQDKKERTRDSGAVVTERPFDQQLLSQRSASSHFQGVTFNEPPEAPRTESKRKSSKGTVEKKNSLEDMKREFDKSSSLVEQILKAAKARTADAMDPTELQASLLGSILTARSNNAVQQALGGLGVYGSTPGSAPRLATAVSGSSYNGREFVLGLTGKQDPITSFSMSANTMTMPMKMMPGLSAQRFKGVIRSPGKSRSGPLRLNRQALGYRESSHVLSVGDLDKPSGFVDRQDRVAIVKFLDSIVKAVSSDKSNHALISQALIILQLFEYRPGYVKRTGHEVNSVVDLDGTAAKHVQSTQDIVDDDSKRKLVDFLAKVAVAPDPKPAPPTDNKGRGKVTKRARDQSEDELDDFGEDPDALHATQYVRERAGVLLHMLSQRSGLLDQFPDLDGKQLHIVRKKHQQPVGEAHAQHLGSTVIGQGLGKDAAGIQSTRKPTLKTGKKKIVAVSTPSLDALFASLNQDRISGGMKGPKGVLKRGSVGSVGRVSPITLDGAFESAASKKQLSRQRLAIFKFQRKLNDRQIGLDLDPKDAMKKRRGEALLSDEEKRRMVLERQRERHEAAEEARKITGRRSRPSLLGFKDTRSFIGLMGELDNRNALGGGARRHDSVSFSPKRGLHDNASKVYASRGLEHFPELEDASAYHGAFNPHGERKSDVMVTQEMLRQLETADEYRNLSLLINLREKMQQRHNSFRLAFQALATGGVHKNKLTKLSFLSAITVLGFKNEDAECLWRYIHTCAGTGKDADISRELTSQEFIGALRYAAPVDSLPQLRERLTQKFGHYKDAFDLWDKDKNGELDFFEFGALCMSIGCTVEAAKKRFFEIVEHNAQESDGIPKVTVDAYVLSLSNAEGLQVVQTLRRQVRPGWHTPMDAFPHLDHEFFHEPLDLTGFQVAVHALGVSGANAKHLFNLATHDEKGRVQLEEIILRILGGLGAHRTRLEEAIRHDRRHARRSTASRSSHALVKHSHTLELDGGVEHHGREGLAGTKRAADRDPYGKSHSRGVRSRGDGSDSTFADFEESTSPSKRPAMARRESTLYAHHDDFQGTLIKAKEVTPYERPRIQTLDKLRQVLLKKFMERGVPLRFENMKFAGVSDSLDIDQWTVMLHGFDVIEEDAAKLFHLIDVDHSGVISREEFNVSLMKFSHYDRHTNPRQRYAHLQRQFLKKVIPMEMVFAAQTMRRMISKEDLVLMFTGIGLSPGDARDLFTMITGAFDKVEVPMYEIVSAVESIIRRPLLADGGRWKRQKRTGSKQKCEEQSGTFASEEEDSTVSLCQATTEANPRSAQGARAPLNLSVAKFPALIANGVRVNAKQESAEGNSMSPQSRRSGLSPSNKKRFSRQHQESINRQVSGDESEPSSPSSPCAPKVALQSILHSTVLQNRVLNAFKDTPQLNDLVHEAFDKVETRDSISVPSNSIPSTPMSPATSASSPRKHKNSFMQDELLTPTSIPTLRFTAEQLEHEAAKEDELASRRFDAFSGSTVEFQIALHLAQDLRRNLMSRNRSIHAAWKSLCKDNKSEDDHINFGDFLHTMTRMKIASLDAERIFRVFELAEGVNPPMPKNFVGTMRFVAPVTSVLMLRKRLVMRYKSISGALAHLQSGLSRGGDFSVDQFEKHMLCYAGIGEHSARWLFKVLDTRHSGFLTWADFVFGLEHAAAYSQLEGLGIQLLRSSKTIEAGVARLLQPEELTSTLDVTLLERLGLPCSIAAEVLMVMTRGVDDAHAVRVDTLVHHLSNVGIGRLHGLDAHATKAPGQAKARGSKNAKLLDELSEDSSGVSDTQITAAILAWRSARRKLIDRFPAGAAQAFSFLDVQGQGEISFPEWVNRLRSSGLFEKEEAICLFGLVIDWKHSHWIPGVRGSPYINRESFIRSLQRAEPVLSLRDIRARLVDELGNLPKAFEQIGGGGDMNFEKWAKALRSMWILRTEAAQSFATFEVGNDDRVSQTAFMKTMRQLEATVKLNDVCQQLVGKHGNISRAFEGIDLDLPLKHRDFVTVTAELFEISLKDCQALLPCVVPQLVGVIQVADLFDCLATVEEQRHRLLVPFGEISAEEERAKGASLDWNLQQDTDANSIKDRTNQRYSVLPPRVPSLNFADLPNDWERTPRRPQAQKKSVIPHVPLNQNASSSASSSLHLPTLTNSPRPQIGTQNLSPVSSPRHTGRSDLSPRDLRVQEWTKRMPKGMAVERETRKRVTATLDQAALSSAKQALLGLDEKPQEREMRPSVTPNLNPAWLNRTRLQPAKNLLT